MKFLWCESDLTIIKHAFADSERVFGSTTRVTRVSSDNVNIAAEHQEPAEVLSQLGNTSTLIEGIRQYDSCNTGELDRHAQHQQPCLASRTLRVVSDKSNLF